MVGITVGLLRVLLKKKKINKRQKKKLTHGNNGVEEITEQQWQSSNVSQEPHTTLCQ
jgi:uncharacterized membrane protein YecN with MAPEG domain